MFYLILIVVLYLLLKPGLPSFLYHQVNEHSNVNTQTFEEHLKILKKKNISTVTVTDLLRGKVKNSVLLTFDDGYYDNYKNVFPLLKKYNVKITIFLNTFYIQDKRSNTSIERSDIANFKAIKKYLSTGDATTDQYMTWSEIKEMYDSGLVDFQAHTHKHMPVFENLKLKGFSNGKEDSTDLYCYKAVKEGYPILRKRGEYSIKAVNIEPIFFEKFRSHYIKYLQNLPKKEALKKGQKYIETLMKYVTYEKDKEAIVRIQRDYMLNKTLIEKHLGNEVNVFCWTWGHKSKLGLKALKNIGVKAFVTTTKGTNSYNVNFDKIRRVELREFTPIKFKINLLVTRSYLLGRIYEILS